MRRLTLSLFLLASCTASPTVDAFLVRLVPLVRYGQAHPLAALGLAGVAVHQATHRPAVVRVECTGEPVYTEPQEGVGFTCLNGGWFRCRSLDCLLIVDGAPVRSDDGWWWCPKGATCSWSRRSPWSAI